MTSPPLLPVEPFLPTDLLPRPPRFDLTPPTDFELSFLVLCFNKDGNIWGVVWLRVDNDSGKGDVPMVSMETVGGGRGTVSGGSLVTNGGGVGRGVVRDASSKEELKANINN